MNPKIYLQGFIVVSLMFRFIRLHFAIVKARRARGTTTAKPIFWIMAASYLVYIASCAVEAFSHLDRFSFLVSFFGMALFIGALLLREMAMRDLGRFFSPDIEIRQKHQVVQNGLYRYMRHPLLACMGLEILGLGLVFNAYLTFLIGGFGMYFPLIWTRKTLEEKKLLETIGPAYRIYQKSVGAFAPKLFQRG